MASGTAARWRVELLGGFRLGAPGDATQPVTRLPSRAITLLLARLALAPERTHAREELIELLWPGVALEVGRNRLRQALSTLRTTLEPPGGTLRPVLVADRLGVRAVSGALACDACEFETHLRAGRVEAARELYRGELLPGYYDEWVDEERARLAALFERIDSIRAVGQAPGAGAGVAEGVLAGGNAAPSPSPSRPTEARHALPHYLTRYFGDGEQAGRLRDAVFAHRLVTLLGPGGCGKTRLAVELAHGLRQSAGDWPHGVSEQSPGFETVVFVPLVASGDLVQALDALLRALQVSAAAGDARAALIDALYGRRSLLVLDNFEQLVAQAAEQAEHQAGEQGFAGAQGLVAELVAALPLLHVLVTSRRALGLDGEREFPLAPLAPPELDLDVDSAALNPAVALFADRARAVRSDFHIGPRNHRVLIELVRELEGMPLAIELAASRTRSIAPAEMLRHLRGTGAPRLELLARGGPRGAADPRHASMQRVIEWSWRQLPAPAARLLAALTVFPGGFDAQAASFVVADDTPPAGSAGPGATPASAARQLDELSAHSLLHAQAGHEPTRFGLYQPIREYAAAQLGAAAARARERLRAWAYDWAVGLPATPSLAVLRAEMPNVLAALSSAVEDGAPDETIRLVLALRRCLEDVELPAAGLTSVEQAIDRCTDSELAARGHTALAPLLFAAGRADAALRHAELGTTCATLPAPMRARALHALARVRWRNRRRPDEVEPLLAAAAVLLEPAHDDPELRASLLALRAFVKNAHYRDFAAGEALHAQALAAWERLGNQHAIDSGRYNLAVCAQSAGRHGEALRRLEPVIASARALQDWRRLSQSLNVQGNAFSGLRAWQQAVASYRECIEVAWDVMAAYDLVFGLWNLPRALAHLRQPHDALRLAAHATALWNTRFGALSRDDQRYLRRVRGMAARLIADPAVAEALWLEGERMPLAQAVALALQPEATPAAPA